MMKHILLTVFLVLSLGAVSQAATVRSQAVKRQFAAANVCPSTGKKQLPCPGYVIDHINPLACGGLDRPSNMQYQTIAAAKAKDKIERRGCKSRTRSPNKSLVVKVPRN